MQIELDSIQCPNCGATLDEHPSHGSIVCPYCGSHFKIVADGGEVDAGEQNADEPQQAFDSIEQLVKSYSLSLIPTADDDECDTLFVDEDLSGEKIYRKAVKNLGLPENETCYLIFDNTVMSSCKTGYAITNGGVYYNYGGKTGRGSMNWQQFAGNKIKRHRKDDAHIYFTDGQDFSMTCCDFTDAVHPVIMRMQEELIAQFFSE